MLLSWNLLDALQIVPKYVPVMSKRMLAKHKMELRIFRDQKMYLTIVLI